MYWNGSNREEKYHAGRFCSYHVYLECKLSGVEAKHLGVTVDSTDQGVEWCGVILAVSWSWGPAVVMDGGGCWGMILLDVAAGILPVGNAETSF